MRADRILAVFADFNERPEIAAPLTQTNGVSNCEVLELKGTDWIDGYLAGCRELREGTSKQSLLPKLLTELDEMRANTAAAVQQASLQVADLLVNSVLTAIFADPARQLPNLLLTVAEQIKPAILGAPEFFLDSSGGVRSRFSTVEDLVRAIDENTVSETTVTIRWSDGEALIGDVALKEDLRQAIFPLSAN